MCIYTSSRTLCIYFTLCLHGIATQKSFKLKDCHVNHVRMTDIRIVGFHILFTGNSTFHGIYLYHTNSSLAIICIALPETWLRCLFVCFFSYWFSSGKFITKKWNALFLFVPFFFFLFFICHSRCCWCCW